MIMYRTDILPINIPPSGATNIIMNTPGKKSYPVCVALNPTYACAKSGIKNIEPISTLNTMKLLISICTNILFLKNEISTIGSSFLFYKIINVTKEILDPSQSRPFTFFIIFNAGINNIAIKIPMRQIGKFTKKQKIPSRFRESFFQKNMQCSVSALSSYLYCETHIFLHCFENFYASRLFDTRHALDSLHIFDPVDNRFQLLWTYCYSVQMLD